MGLIVAGKSDIGRKRKTNQDSMFISLEKKFFLVADGMGGHNGGDIASQIAVSSIPKFLFSNNEPDPEKSLLTAITQSNSTIKKYASEHPELQGMGTTAVSLLFRGQSIYIGNIGDSRAYLVNNKKLFQLSRDHSLVQEKITHGVYTREEAAYDPQKNVLVRTLGFEDEVEIDVFSYKVIRNDIFLICSDGLYGRVSDEDLIFLVNNHIPNPATATQENVNKLVNELVDLANSNGGQDNITVIVVIAQ